MKKVSKSQKSNLAKLLATENLNVEHRKVSTAFFDVGARTLVLPIWQEMSNDLYDMLVGHEVGHALYTPNDTSFMKKGIPHSMMNVLEDVRIDRKMKLKYPGLKKCYFNGHGELREKEFFKTKDRPWNTLKFIDRLNIHTKNGSVEPVPFTDEEMAFVQKSYKTETFEDVINLAIEIGGYAKEEKVDKYEPDPLGDEKSFGEEEQEEQEEQVGPSDEGQELNQEEQEEQEVSEEEKTKQEEEEKFTESSSKEEDKEEEKDKEKEQKKNSTGPQASYDPENDTVTPPANPLESETDNNLTEQLKSLVKKDARDIVYANLPSINLNKIIIPWKELHEKLDKHYSELRDGKDSHGKPDPEKKWIDEVRTKFNTYSQREFAKFKRDNSKVVSYLVKEFEMKKAAEQYKRASIAKTGVIDVNKLHSYQYAEDIFKKMTIIPGGKNHGLLMFIDWSGSMSDALYDTMTQLFNLTMFCRQVNIPFEVYAFSDINSNLFYKNDYGYDNTQFEGRRLRDYGNFTYKVGDKLFENITLLNFMSSKMNAKAFNHALLNCYKIALYNRDYFGYRRATSYGNVGLPTENYVEPVSIPSWCRLGGTPLNSAIYVATELVAKFQKDYGISKMNTVFLTDGSSHDNTSVVVNNSKDGNMDVECRYASDIIVRDPKTKLIAMELSDSYHSGYGTTKQLLEFLQEKTGSKVIGFYVYSRRQLGGWEKSTFFGRNWYTEFEKRKKQFTKDKVIVSPYAGYDSLFMIQSKNLHIEEDELDINEQMSVAQMKRNFGKTMKAKLTSRVLLTKFVDLVA